MKNPALLNSVSLYPLAGTVSVEWGKAYHWAEGNAQHYCDLAGPSGYGSYTAKRPVVTCKYYDQLSSGKLANFL